MQNTCCMNAIIQFTYLINSLTCWAIFDESLSSDDVFLFKIYDYEKFLYRIRSEGQNTSGPDQAGRFVGA